jgi:tetratricopeptide (TPR) repeat protein
LYCARHLIVFFAVIYVPNFSMPDGWKQLQSQQVMLFSDVLVVGIMFVAGQRTEHAHKVWGWLWQRSRMLLMFAVAFDLILFVWMHGNAVLGRRDEIFLAAVFVVLLDFFVIVYLHKSTLIGDLFADLPVATPPKFAPTPNQTNAKTLSTDAQQLHAQAWQLLKQTELAKAVVLMRKAVDLAPQSSLYCRDLVEIYRNLGSGSQAIFYARRGVDLTPADALAHVTLALTFNDVGQYQDAVTACRRALEIDENHLVALNTLGVLLCNQGDSDAGRHLFERALQVDPSNVTAKINLSAFVGHAGAVRFANGLAPNLRYVLDPMTNPHQESLSV